MSSRSTTPGVDKMRSRASSQSSDASKRSTSRRRKSRRRLQSNASTVSVESQESAHGKPKASLRGKNQFSKITALIKDKDRRAKKEAESGAPQETGVSYVDSARAAGASGMKDLRGDILKHRNRLKNEEDQEDTDSPAFLLLIEQAEWDLHIQKYWTAVKYLGRASSIVQDDAYVLTLRAQARLGCHDYHGALADADRVLVFLREPDNPAALIARGDSYYFLGRFEHALVSYYRAQCQENLMTKEKEHLVNVIARARNAILNAVKDSTENFFDDMKNMIESEEFDVDLILNEETEKKEPKFVDEFESIIELSPAEISAKKEAERLEDAQLLEEFSEDKAFLESITSKVRDNNKLFEEVDSGLNFLIVRKNFWRQHGTNLKM